jgi:hypothetical protein
MSNVPSNNFLTNMGARMIQLNPRKFGIVGSYAQEMLHAEVGQDSSAFMMDHLLVRLTTSVLSGRTISAEPVVELDYPATWWQHWKHASNEWINVKHDLWVGHLPDGSDTTPPPWLILLWPLLVLWPKWFAKHPVKLGVMTGKVQIDQDILYPQLDMPANAGMPVIYETIEMPIFEPTTEGWNTRLTKTDPSRFMCKGEIISAVHREMSDPGKYRGDDVWAFVDWLESKGVNIEQLVKR